MTDESSETNWKVNWTKKSDHIKELSQELNLSTNSFIFLDDNPFECMEAQTSCPEVLILNLPKKNNDVKKLLKHVLPEPIDGLNVYRF